MKCLALLSSLSPIPFIVSCVTVWSEEKNTSSAKFVFFSIEKGGQQTLYLLI